MVTFKLPTNNEQIAADLKATFGDSNARLNAALASSFSKPVEPQPRETSNLGAVNFGSFRMRLATSLRRPLKDDART
jgi:hypothetical protein